MSTELLEQLISKAPTGIVLVRSDASVVLANDQATAMGICDGVTVEPKLAAHIREVFEQQQQVVAELSLPRRIASRVRAVEASIVPLAIDERQYVVVYATDESEHVRMESARRDFVANVSHELKTPVGGMALLAEVVLQSADDPDAVNHFGSKLLKEAHRMSNLINELIALSKLQGAEKLPDMSPVAVEAVIDEAVERNRIAAEEARITIERGEASDAYVLGDVTLLVTAMSNLVVNAINYSPESKTVRITHDVTRAPTGQETVKIRVIDQGIGISPEDQNRVFERFYRVDKARSRRTGGTGLGLAIVKHVAANHGGSITVSSELGRGSTFTLELPVHNPPVHNPNA